VGNIFKVSYRTGVMKYILVILLLCFGTYDEKAYCTGISVVNAIETLNQQQQEPFYFVTPVPPAKKLLENIDLSFFKNRLTVSTYRYRIQFPEGAETSIDRRLSIWSGWTRSELAEIKIPRLDLEGGYKLIVEYNPVKGNETRRFEVPFYVYYSSPARTASNAGYTEKAAKGQAARETIPSSESLAERKSASARTGTAVEKTETKPLNPEAVKPPSSNKASRKRNDFRDLSSVKLPVNIRPQIVTFMPSSADLNAWSQGPPVFLSEINDSLYIPDGIVDSVFIAESSLGFEGIEPVNMSDNGGNNELHLALMSGQNDYVRELISTVADLNLKNYFGFAPIHLAVMLNNEEIVDELIRNGADINAAGKAGYTPLHIAYELNVFDTASDLIFNGARTGVRTDQGFTPKMIAKIQGNTQIAKLLTKRDSAIILLHKALPGENGINVRPALTGNKIELNLSYDNTLVKKRRINNVLRFIAIPVFAISASGYVSFKSKANHNFSLSRVAETESIAKTLYDKGVNYNRTANITGGVSVVSAYAIIHTTLRIRSITTKMAKVF
jgi:ankyrin repeat protein